MTDAPHKTESTAGPAPHPAAGTGCHPEHPRQNTGAGVAGEAVRSCRVFGAIRTAFADGFFDQPDRHLLGAGDDPCGMPPRRLGRRAGRGAPRQLLRTNPGQHAGTRCSLFAAVVVAAADAHPPLLRPQPPARLITCHGSRELRVPHMVAPPIATPSNPRPMQTSRNVRGFTPRPPRTCSGWRARPPWPLPAGPSWYSAGERNLAEPCRVR